MFEIFIIDQAVIVLEGNDTLRVKAIANADNERVSLGMAAKDLPPQARPISFEEAMKLSSCMEPRSKAFLQTTLAILSRKPHNQAF